MTSAEYLEMHDNCVKVAAETITPEVRDMYLYYAQVWLDMARRASQVRQARSVGVSQCMDEWSAAVAAAAVTLRP